MRAFDKTKDLHQINTWLKERSLPMLTEDEVPKYGQIEDDVACGFLCLTDVSTCFLEAYITNPEATSEDRNNAIGRITRWGLGMAAAMQHKRIIVIGNEASLIKRALSYGFTLTSAQVAVLDLK